MTQLREDILEEVMYIDACYSFADIPSASVRTN